MQLFRSGTVTANPVRLMTTVPQAFVMLSWPKWLIARRSVLSVRNRRGSPRMAYRGDGCVRWRALVAELAAHKTKRSLGERSHHFAGAGGGVKYELSITRLLFGPMLSVVLSMNRSCAVPLAVV